MRGGGKVIKGRDYSSPGRYNKRILSSPSDYIVPNTPPQEIKQDPKELNNRPPTNILLVEDNWDHAYLTMKTLTATGRYQVELVSSGSEALYKLAGKKFSLLLSDYNLSGMNGLELIRRVKEAKYEVPTIMVTGLGSEMVAVEAMKLGAYDYIVKSGDYLSTLPFVVDKALERYELKKLKEQWDHWILKRTRELGALNAVAAEISKSLRLEEVVRAALDKAAEIFEADYGEIWVLDEKEEIVLTFKASFITSEETLTLPLTVQVIQHMKRSDDALVLEDLTKRSDSIWRDLSNALGSACYIPLRSKKKLLGVLAIGARKAYHLTAQDAMLLSAIGSEIGVAMENARLYEETQQQAEKIKQDIAEQKRLQEQLIRSEKLAAIGQFVAGIAHELNNPLASITGFTQLLLGDERLHTELRDLLQKIYGEAKRASQIVHNLLAFARERKTEKTYVDVNELLTRTLMLRNNKLKLDNILLVKEVKPNLPWTFADPLQLQLVFLNIIINAEQAMVGASGQGKLEIKTRVRNPEKAQEKPKFIEVLFTDSGPGISKKNLRRIFDPFFTTKPSGQGTGLGLSIAYGIIKEHGGEIYVESEQSKGTTFTVVLPIVQLEAAKMQGHRKHN